MPRYFFHVRKGSAVELDEDGLDFPSVDEAKAEARRAAREILIDKAISGDPSNEEVFEITNEDGRIVCAVPIRSSGASS
ncbi:MULTISPECIES: hypothetical protein [unclassified Rhizobium]|uniref:DUF6894 family protein n=1 Tax=unclassified Rhizobium TaxID=2613769 RepID=UPI0012E3F0AC|nr:MULTISPECIES: hypothetical protein [unclassified Rhizobium]